MSLIGGILNADLHSLGSVPVLDSGPSSTRFKWLPFWENVILAPTRL